MYPFNSSYDLPVSISSISSFQRDRVMIADSSPTIHSVMRWDFPVALAVTCRGVPFFTTLNLTLTALDSTVSFEIGVQSSF